jgi:hypothetical protein
MPQAAKPSRDAETTITPRVIGAGFGRTGTASLKRALEMIGFGPCHHMEEVIKHPAEVKTWEAAARGQKVDWRAFLQGWRATVDFPSALYYRELIEAFPDVKVILTVRDAESWYASVSQTIVPAMTRFPNRFVAHYLPFIGAPARSMRGTRVYREIIERFAEREHVLRVFTNHIEEVKRVVPAERLLVYQVSEGWKPLCAFLGVPMPDAPFPRANDTAEFKRAILAITAVCWVVLLLPLALVLGLVFLGNW